MRRELSWVIVWLWVPIAAVAAESDILIADFQQEPLPQTWAVEGYAFGARKPGPKAQQAARTTGNQRQYQFGTLTSPTFAIERNAIVVEVDGVYHPTKCCVALIIDGNDVRRAFRGETVLDVREFLGKQARLEVRDHHFNGWVTLKRIFQTDRLPEDAQKAIPTWQPAAFESRIDGPYLLLPVDDRKAPIQAVTIEIDGNEKLTVDLPLAMGETPNLLPVYDLTGFQDKTLRVRYHQTADSKTDRLIRLSDIPKPQADDSRPAFHVHCRFGKLNDPNGLVYFQGQYHLFHQYYYGVRAKHWAHWVSRDLIHWEERPIGLFPDETGSMHSGSAAVDWHNTGGFQSGDTPAIIAAFTGSRGLGGNDKVQVQGIAYSIDGGRTFTKYAGNPVLGEEHLKTLKTDSSRDPKIFWYSPSRGMDPKAEDGHWVMVLFEDGGHSLFTSADLKQWKKHGRIHGFYECPELFPLAVDGNPRELRWIMYGGDGQYHIGAFDGQSFEPQTSKKIRFHYGNAYYAAQTFSNTTGMPPRRIEVGWQGNQISLPIELSLRTTPLGLRVCALPVAEIENLRTNTANLDGLTVTPGDANPLQKCAGGLYDIELDAQLEDAEELALDVGGQVIRYDAKGGKLTCGKHMVTLPEAEGRLVLRVVVDHWSVDIFAGEKGLFHMPLFTKRKTKSLGMQVIGGSAKFDCLRVHELKSIW